MVILFLPKYINDAHPGQSINTVMCHYDTWLTPYVEVLLYEYVVNWRRLSVVQYSNLCWIGLFFGPNAVGLRLVCLCQLAWKNVEIIHSIPVKQWLFHCSGNRVLSALFWHHRLHCNTQMFSYATAASSLIWFN